jgi:biopolymer transport protein ExbB
MFEINEETMHPFLYQAFEIWSSGGWGMMALAVNALVLFALGTHIMLKLYAKGFHKVPEHVWMSWIKNPQDRKGPIGRMLDYVFSANSSVKSLEENATVFTELRTIETVPFERDLKVMQICVSAAPLLGLLGTVTGMLSTFGALASGSGGDKTMGMVAKGISEALITTETGLVIALTGLFFHYQLVRLHNRYKNFLIHLETICTQKVYRRLRKGKNFKVPAVEAELAA